MWRRTGCGKSRWHQVVPTAVVALLVLAPAAMTETHGLEAHDGSADRQQRYARSYGSYRPPPVILLDSTGAPFDLQAELRRLEPLALQFIFTTCPTVCPLLSATFAAAQDEFGNELARLRMISISIDPEHDTPARLSEYARNLRASPRWRFLTGRLEDVVAVQKAFDAFQGNKMRHLPLTYLRRSPRVPWLRLDGFVSAAELVDEYHRLPVR